MNDLIIEFRLNNKVYVRKVSNQEIRKLSQIPVMARGLRMVNPPSNSGILPLNITPQESADMVIIGDIIHASESWDENFQILRDCGYL